MVHVRVMMAPRGLRECRWVVARGSSAAFPMQTGERARMLQWR
jgi:hypothetical protein